MIKTKTFEDVVKDINKDPFIKYTILWWIRYGIWNWLEMLPRRIYWFFQRGFNGFSDQDVWNFDSYLAEVISKGLKQFRTYYHGEKPSKNELSDIILGFEENLKVMNLDYKYNSKSYKRAEERFNKGMELFKKYFNYFYD